MKLETWEGLSFDPSTGEAIIVIPPPVYEDGETERDNRLINKLRQDARKGAVNWPTNFFFETPYSTEFALGQPQRCAPWAFLKPTSVDRLLDKLGAGLIEQGIQFAAVGWGDDATATYTNDQGASIQPLFIHFNVMGKVVKHNAGSIARELCAAFAYDERKQAGVWCATNVVAALAATLKRETQKAE